MALTKEAKEKSEISTEEEIIHINIISTNSNRYSEKEIKKLGTTLYDKNLENGEKWDIVVNSNTLEKYGTGWNYIEKEKMEPIIFCTFCDDGSHVTSVRL